jgi:hypothetical protein
MRTRHKILVGLIFLYAATWIGGYYSYSAALRHETQIRYQNAKKADRKYGDLAPGDEVKWVVPRAGEHGPDCRVRWCFPILPGVLIASSYYYVGPLYAEDGVRLVCFYGFGCWSSRLLYGTMS